MINVPMRVTLFLNNTMNLLRLQNELKSADKADEKQMTLQNYVDTFISKLDKFRSIKQSSMPCHDGYATHSGSIYRYQNNTVFLRILSVFILH